MEPTDITDPAPPPVPPVPPVPPIKVREATVRDAKAITQAQVAAWQQAYRGIMGDRYLDELSAEMTGSTNRRRVSIAAPEDPRVFNLVGEYQGEVAGWLCAGPSRDDRDARLGEIWELYVHPDLWRAGIGSALMTAALARLSGEGYAEATLWVFEANTRARGFYERFGWVMDGATAIFERGGSQAVEVRYRRPLT